MTLGGLLSAETLPWATLSIQDMGDGRGPVWGFDPKSPHLNQALNELTTPGIDALYEKRRDKSVPRGKFAPLVTISLRDLREALDR